MHDRILGMDVQVVGVLSEFSDQSLFIPFHQNPNICWAIILPVIKWFALNTSLGFAVVVFWIVVPADTDVVVAGCVRESVGSRSFSTQQRLVLPLAYRAEFKNLIMQVCCIMQKWRCYADIGLLVNSPFCHITKTLDIVEIQGLCRPKEAIQTHWHVL